MIGRLTLSDFRNHADALIMPDHSFIVLTGDNGAGKTTILEAVSMLAPGRGLRGAALRDMARKDGAAGSGIPAAGEGVVLGPDRNRGGGGQSVSVSEHVVVGVRMK